MGHLYGCDKINKEYMRIFFGKYNGQDLEDIPTTYLVWLSEQEWIEEKYPELMIETENEIEYRNKFDKNF
jgi:uncharacterized protein (DUF3820 family)